MVLQLLRFIFCPPWKHFNIGFEKCSINKKVIIIMIMIIIIMLTYMLYFYRVSDNSKCIMLVMS